MCIIYTEYKTIDYRQTVHVVDDGIIYFSYTFRHCSVAILFHP